MEQTKTQLNVSVSHIQTKVLKDGERAPRPTGESTVAAALDHSISHHEKAMSVAERDKALMEAWKDREGSLANARFEDGQVEEGYRRNVVSLWAQAPLDVETSSEGPWELESEHLSIYLIKAFFSLAPKLHVATFKRVCSSTQTVDVSARYSGFLNYS